MSKTLFKLETTSDRASTLKKMIDKERGNGGGEKGGEFNAKKLHWYVTNVHGIESIQLGMNIGFNSFARDNYADAYKDYERECVCASNWNDSPVGMLRLTKGPSTVTFGEVEKSVYEAKLVSDDIDVVVVSSQESSISYLNSLLEPCEAAQAKYKVLSLLYSEEEHKALCMIRKKNIDEGGGGHEYTLTTTTASVVSNVTSSDSPAVVGVNETQTDVVTDVTINDPNEFSYVNDVTAEDGVLVFSFGTYSPVTASKTTDTALKSVTTSTSNFVSSITKTSKTMIKTAVLNEV